MCINARMRKERRKQKKLKGNFLGAANNKQQQFSKVIVVAVLTHSQSLCLVHKRRFYMYLKFYTLDYDHEELAFASGWVSAFQLHCHWRLFMHHHRASKYCNRVWFSIKVTN